MAKKKKWRSYLPGLASSDAPNSAKQGVSGQTFAGSSFGCGLKKIFRKRRWWCLVVTIAIMGCAALFSSGESTELKILETEKIQRGSLKKELPVTGVVKPEEGAEVKTGTRFTGVIRQLFVKLGDSVKKGQLVAELDDREQQAECKKIEATVRKLQAELQQVEVLFPKRIAEAASQIKVEQAEARFAEVNYSRLSKLRSASSSVTDTDRAREQLVITKERIVIQRSLMERLQSEMLLEQARLKEALAEAESELISAQTRLSYATIFSPMNGVVSEITAQEGETLVAGLQVAYLITVMDPSRLELQMYVDENDIGMVHPGAQVFFTVESFRDKTFSGTVDLVHPGPEIRNNIVYYRALVRLSPEVALQLRPEMTARCRVVVAEKDDVLLVPNTAFKWLGNRRVVFVKDAAGKVLPVSPELGLAGATHTEILQGLDDSHTILTRVDLPSPLPEEWLQ